VTGHGVRTWWRRERVAILLLPVVLVAAVAASSSRIDTYWWQKGFHEQASRDATGVAMIDDEYDDGFLRYPIRAKVSVVTAQVVTELPDADRPLRVPAGAELWEVKLRWSADPDVSLTGCKVALVDDRERRFDATRSSFEAGTTVPLQACVPDEAPGPQPTYGSTKAPAVASGEVARPASWQTRVYIVTPEDAEPTAVRVWWLLPRYAELPLD